MDETNVTLEAYAVRIAVFPLCSVRVRCMPYSTAEIGLVESFRPRFSDPTRGERKLPPRSCEMWEEAKAERAALISRRALASLAGLPRRICAAAVQQPPTVVCSRCARWLFPSRRRSS
ncbi:hypothetical protein MRX96_016639 [Rhipicephalus microplus]